MMRETENPNRKCINCGIAGNSYKMYRGDKVIYSAFCRDCNNKRAKSKTYTVCGICKCDKEPTYIRYCSACLKDKYHGNSNIISYEDLKTLKMWVRKQEIRNWMTDIMGINELINIYELIKRGEDDFETYTPGKQLQRMWEKVYRVWMLIKDLDDKSLKMVKIDKTYLRIDNKTELEIMNTTQEELNFFFKNMNSFTIDAKEYSLEVEYKNCINGVTKTSCVRCRKIIKQLRKDLINLNIKTGVKWSYNNLKSD